MTDSQFDLQKALDICNKVEEEAKAVIAAAAEKAPDGVSIAGGVDGSLKVSIAGEAEAKASAESVLASLGSASKREIIMKYHWLGSYHVYIWQPYLDALYAMSWDESRAVLEECFSNGGFSALTSYIWLLLMKREDFSRLVAGNSGLMININPLEVAMMRTAVAAGPEAMIISATTWIYANPSVVRLPR